MDTFQYPIGKFEPSETVDNEQREAWIKQLADTPAILRTVVRGFSEQQLDTPYRPGGWSVRQVVHHLPDSHMNSYVRFKLALTEDCPTIKPYKENLWAQLDDYQNTPIDVSLTLLDSLHARWVRLLSSLTDCQFSRTFTNPESGATFTLETALELYAWHSRHHIAQITSLKERMGW